jgi:hypothetical protein
MPHRFDTMTDADLVKQARDALDELSRRLAWQTSKMKDAVAPRVALVHNRVARYQDSFLSKVRAKDKARVVEDLLTSLSCIDPAFGRLHLQPLERALAHSNATTVTADLLMRLGLFGFKPGEKRSSAIKRVERSIARHPA